MGYSTVIVTSLYTQQRFRDILGDEGIERVVVLPHIASPSDPKMLSHERSLATPASTPLIPQPYLLYPSNVSEHKNHLALMLALSKRRRKDVQLVLCGYGTESIGHQELKENPYLNRLNKSIRDRGLQSDIDYRALGYVSDEQSEDLLSNALGLIMPTRAEGMGLPIHEAIERGLPVIASDIPVLREHYDSRSNAILWVDPDCPADIAEAWDSLCERSHSLKSLARATNLGSGVSWADIASRTVNILDEAIQTHRPVLRIAPLKRRRRWMKKIEKSIKKLWRRAG
jgi:glycosyltransferase involved in cell wall biosynthesis